MSYSYTKKPAKTFLKKAQESDRWDHSGWEELQQEQGDNSKGSQGYQKLKKPRKNYKDNSSLKDNHGNLKNENKTYRDSIKWQHVYLFANYMFLIFFIG